MISDILSKVHVLLENGYLKLISTPEAYPIS